MKQPLRTKSDHYIKHSFSISYSETHRLYKWSREGKTGENKQLMGGERTCSNLALCPKGKEQMTSEPALSHYNKYPRQANYTRERVCFGL